MHFERRKAFQNAQNYFFKKIIIKKVLPNLPKIFRPVTRSTYFLPLALLYFCYHVCLCDLVSLPLGAFDWSVIITFPI